MLNNNHQPAFYPVLTPEDARRAEQEAFSLGVPSILLMEHAALAVVDELEKALGGSCSGKQVLFLCGTGNNGGDGFAAARLFARRGGKPVVWMLSMPKTSDANANLQWLGMYPDVEIIHIDALPDNVSFADIRFRRPYDAYVDALFGTGFHGELNGKEAAIAQVPRRYSHMASSPVPVIAVDIPSGIDGKTGETRGPYMRADVTVTFNTPKLGLYLTQARDAVGKIVVADIGLWTTVARRDHMPELKEPEINCITLNPPALEWMEKRAVTAHKGNCGRVLIYAGKTGMAGAAAMCAKAAVTAGAGLTTIACEKEIIPILQTLAPNAMCIDINEAVENSPAYDVFAVGCGLGQSEETWQNILKLWNPDKHSVWDADALNLLSKHEMKLGENAVITPHPGEAARLLGWRVSDIMADRLKAARALAEKYECAAVLKSDVSVICGTEGGELKYYLNTVGSPALAKGGSGDALTGILAALLHDNTPLDAAALACLWHGMAGIVGEEKYGQRELTTDQLISCLSDAERWGRGERPAPASFR